MHWTSHEGYPSKDLVKHFFIGFADVGDEDNNNDNDDDNNGEEDNGEHNAF